MTTTQLQTMLRGLSRLFDGFWFTRPAFKRKLRAYRKRMGEEVRI